MKARLVVGCGLALFCFAQTGENEGQWQWWYTCTWACKHQFRHTGLPDTVAKRGDVVAERVTCPDGWVHNGNQYTAFFAEYQHRESQFPDKKERKRAMKLRHVPDNDGIHYAH